MVNSIEWERAFVRGALNTRYALGLIYGPSFEALTRDERRLAQGRPAKEIWKPVDIGSGTV